MMTKHFLNLFQYNDWANHRMLVTLEQNDLKNTKIQLLFSHVLSSQIVWLNRIKALPTSPFPLWEFYKLRELRSMTEESTFNWINFINDLKPDSYLRRISYQNSQQQQFETSLREIMTQVINHSSYHRGQIALLLREEGIDPPGTDFIVYTRI